MSKVEKNSTFCLYLAIVLLGNGFKRQSKLQDDETERRLSFAGFTCLLKPFPGCANIERSKNWPSFLQPLILRLRNEFKRRSKLQIHRTDPLLLFAGLTCLLKPFPGSAND